MSNTETYLTNKRVGLAIDTSTPKGLRAMEAAVAFLRLVSAIPIHDHRADNLACVITGFAAERPTVRLPPGAAVSQHGELAAIMDLGSITRGDWIRGPPDGAPPLVNLKSARSFAKLGQWDRPCQYGVSLDPLPIPLTGKIDASKLDDDERTALVGLLDLYLNGA